MPKAGGRNDTRSSIDEVQGYKKPPVKSTLLSTTGRSKNCEGGRAKTKGANMDNLTNLNKIIATIVIVVVALLLVGWGGQLDHDEYIEANLTPQTRMSY